MRGVAQEGRSVGADRLIALTGFVPSTMHALGVRAARDLPRRLVDLADLIEQEVGELVRTFR